MWSLFIAVIIDLIKCFFFFRGGMLKLLYNRIQEIYIERKNAF